MGHYANPSTSTGRVSSRLGQIFPICGLTAKIYDSSPHRGNFSIAEKSLFNISFPDPWASPRCKTQSFNRFQILGHRLGVSTDPLTYFRSLGITKV
ncbi:hypothetical protein FCV25MIE_29210, partial [Fagus crenata]